MLGLVCPSDVALCCLQPMLSSQNRNTDVTFCSLAIAGRGAWKHSAVAFLAPLMCFKKDSSFVNAIYKLIYTSMQATRIWFAVVVPSSNWETLQELNE